MPAGSRPSRSATWLDSLGEWSWPGQRVATAEAMPPAWVPTYPPPGASGPAAAVPLPAPWQRARTLLVGVLLSALVAAVAALVLHRQLGLDGSQAIPKARIAAAAERSLLPSPALTSLSTDAAGSTIAKSSYHSVALHREGSFYVYLPPGLHAKSATAARYPVIYLLHGNSQSATAFLRIGLQGELDRLIAAHAIPPMIAVMIQGGAGANNWRNLGDFYYESYVLEVQEIVDRMLPTVASRGGRAIAGLSMGGYGAMALTLNNPYRFGVVESWLGFFNGLEGQLRLDRHAISTLGLHAFVYGGASDKIADPSEDAPFAARLRAEGASAHSAIYPGEHNLETVQAHLSSMLAYAGRSLGAASTARHGSR